MKKIVIAIDGHSSSGKSTMAKDLAKEIETLEERIKNVPYIDDIDLRFRNVKKETVPNTSANSI